VLLDQLDRKTGQSCKKKPKFVVNGQLVRCIIECSQPVCLELFSDVSQLGRFFLRDEGRTIAIGKVTALGPKKPTTAN
jgi:peptide chain release factor subunit 3